MTFALLDLKPSEITCRLLAANIARLRLAGNPDSGRTPGERRFHAGEFMAEGGAGVHARRVQGRSKLYDLGCFLERIRDRIDRDA